MNKTQLIDAIALGADLSKTKAAQVLDVTLDSIVNALKALEEVRIPKFGSFIVKKRAARAGRDPRTGNPLHIPEANVPGFKPGKELKDAVNGLAVTTEKV